MDRRLQLQEELESILGNEEVHFQPPSSVKLIYPCIIYTLSSGDHQYADDRVYSFRPQYTITYIHTDPDDETYQKILFAFPYCSFDRRYVADNLYHDVLTLYY